MKRWHLKSAAINEVVFAPDQYAAFDTLRARPIDDFGLIVTAEADENAEPIGVRITALLESWGRVAEAHVIRAVVAAGGGPDTTDLDRQFAKERAGGMNTTPMTLNSLSPASRAALDTVLAAREAWVRVRNRRGPAADAALRTYNVACEDAKRVMTRESGVPVDDEILSDLMLEATL